VTGSGPTGRSLPQAPELDPTPRYRIPRGRTPEPNPHMPPLPHPPVSPETRCLSPTRFRSPWPTRSVLLRVDRDTLLDPDLRPTPTPSPTPAHHRPSFTGNPVSPHSVSPHSVSPHSASLCSSHGPTAAEASDSAGPDRTNWGRRRRDETRPAATGRSRVDDETTKRRCDDETRDERCSGRRTASQECGTEPVTGETNASICRSHSGHSTRWTDSACVVEGRWARSIATPSCRPEPQ
jgi:hypothetical protein